MYVLFARCYDKDSYPSDSHDEFIWPVSLSGTMASAHQDSSLHPGSEGSQNVAQESNEAVKIVVEEYNRQDDDDEYYKLVQVHEASSQVSYYCL